MRFHLDLSTGSSPDKIHHGQKILLMGSCFTEHISKRLSDLKFNCFSNPFGIVFNPVSMHNALSRILSGETFGESDLVEHNASWLSLETHSSLNRASKNELLHTLNSLVNDWHHYLKTADWLVLTFGSAYCYEHNDTQNIIANCHKLPAKLFTKKLAESSGLIASYKILLERIRAFNPGIRILFTISPVKHLRDGVVENNLSKSILTVTTHAIVNDNSNSFYFPAYELVNDDLRDYRFYEADMAHPNRQAIDYVWQKFGETFFDEKTHALLDRLAALNTAFNHIPLHSGTKAFSDFKSAQLEKCRSLKSEFPYLDLQTELDYFSQT